jgi:hypothetical protein
MDVPVFWRACKERGLREKLHQSTNEAGVKYDNSFVCCAVGTRHGLYLMQRYKANKTDKNKTYAGSLNVPHCNCYVVLCLAEASDFTRMLHLTEHLATSVSSLSLISARAVISESTSVFYIASS